MSGFSFVDDIQQDVAKLLAANAKRPDAQMRDRFFCRLQRRQHVGRSRDQAGVCLLRYGIADLIGPIPILAKRGWPVDGSDLRLSVSGPNKPALTVAVMTSFPRPCAVPSHATPAITLRNVTFLWETHREG